jgi:hypothetical protein
MTRAISRDSFDELKNYLGVYQQQGRVILDSDWNESQDIALSLLRRVVRDSVGDGSPNDGFRIESAYPAPPLTSLTPEDQYELTAAAIQAVFGPLAFFMQFPGDVLDDFESANNWRAPGRLRSSRDRPYRGQSFLRLSEHPPAVRTEVRKQLAEAIDLSRHELATFRYRLNASIPGDFSFFLEDESGNRTVWTNTNDKDIPENFWLIGVVTPLVPSTTPSSPPETVPQAPAIARPVRSTGTAADLKKIRAYGFDVYQSADPKTLLVWDFDFLNFGSRALKAELARNNFIIRGSAAGRRNVEATLARLKPKDLTTLDPAFDVSEPADAAGCLYVNGLPCVQIPDVLYTDQADPNDPVLQPPSEPGQIDAVYLDAWQEPVTYVEDPEIRDLALGGPDTATRLRARHRVRVAQGRDVPEGNGRGLGTLSTEGIYEGKTNRLYLVEIDRSGNIGTATCRWSEDNASSIQRAIGDIPQGSTRVEVEDASGFTAGDSILIRKEFGDEEHQIKAVSGNVIVLATPTGAQLAQSPAAKLNPTFTHFSKTERPKVQRWNQLHVPITPDPEDPTVSLPIPLSNHGIRLRFGGSSMRTGDFWTFKARHLGAHGRSGASAEQSIDRLSFARARGVVHHCVRLGSIVHNPALPHPVFRDYRNTTKGARRVAFRRDARFGFDFRPGTANYIGGALFNPAPDSELLFLFSSIHYTGEHIPRAIVTLKATVCLYDDTATDPQVAPEKGKLVSADVLFAQYEAASFFESQHMGFGSVRAPARAHSRVSSLHLFIEAGEPNIVGLPTGKPKEEGDLTIANVRLAAIELKTC